MLARDLKVRYQRSILGIGWSLVRPLAQLAIFLFLFGKVVPLGIHNYATFLFSGVLAWSWFNNAAMAAASAVTDNPELVRRPGFPPIILPMLSVGSEAIHYLLALPILLLVAFFETGSISWTILFIPLIFLAQFIFTLGIACVVAALHVQFRDTQNAVGIALMLGFYLTPVFYRRESLMASYALLNTLNPMAHLLTAYRAVLVDHSVPSFPALIGTYAFSLALLAFAAWIFARFSHSFIEEL